MALLVSQPSVGVARNRIRRDDSTNIKPKSTASNSLQKGKQNFKQGDSVLLCCHILVSRKCLLDALSGLEFDVLRTKYPTNLLQECTCTNLWKLNSVAREERLSIPWPLRILPFRKPKSQSLRSKRVVLLWQQDLLVIPRWTVARGSIAQFLTTERISKVLSGCNISLCRHSRLSKPVILQTMWKRPPDTIDRSRCGQNEPCECGKYTMYPVWRCAAGCGVGVRLNVSHQYFSNQHGSLAAGPYEQLSLHVGRGFAELDTGMHPSWTTVALEHEGAGTPRHPVREVPEWKMHKNICWKENEKWCSQEMLHRANHLNSSPGLIESSATSPGNPRREGQSPPPPYTPYTLDPGTGIDWFDDLRR